MIGWWSAVLTRPRSARFVGSRRRVQESWHILLERGQCVDSKCAIGFWEKIRPFFLNHFFVKIGTRRNRAHLLGLLRYAWKLFYYLPVAEVCPNHLKRNASLITTYIAFSPTPYLARKYFDAKDDKSMVMHCKIQLSRLAASCSSVPLGRPQGTFGAFCGELNNSWL